MPRRHGPVGGARHPDPFEQRPGLRRVAGPASRSASVEQPPLGERPRRGPRSELLGGLAEPGEGPLRVAGGLAPVAEHHRRGEPDVRLRRDRLDLGDAFEPAVGLVELPAVESTRAIVT